MSAHLPFNIIRRRRAAITTSYSSILGRKPFRKALRGGCPIGRKGANSFPSIGSAAHQRHFGAREVTKEAQHEELLEDVAQGAVEIISVAHSAEPLSHASINKQGEVSVVSSSPPTSVQLRFNLLNIPRAEESWLSEPQEAFDDDLQSSYIAGTKLQSRTSAQPNMIQSSRRRVPFHNPKFSRVFSLSRIDEHQEVSIIATCYDERSRSLTLSISTPLPTTRAVSIPVPPNSDTEHAFFPSMSSLSNFSLHQDDARHVQSRYLIKCGQQVIIRSTGIRKSALLADGLIKNITAAEPDEHCWDWMRALNLKNKNLNNVYMLDEFYPRVEELDLSNNKLTQMSGVLPSIRQLNVQLSRLTSLTTWVTWETCSVRRFSERH